MRIGLRVSARSSGGGRAFVEKLSRELSIAEGCSGVQVFVMGIGGEGTFDVPNKVVVPVDADPIRRRVYGGKALAAAVAEHPVDVMVAPGTEVTPLDKLPTIMWPLTVAPFEVAAMETLATNLRQRARWNLLRQSIRLAAQHADGFVFSSHYARALYMQAVPTVGRSPHAVIPPAATVLPTTCEPFAGQLPDRYVLFVSHLYPYKMVVEMIEGFGLARAAGLEHHLVIAGGDVNRPYAGRIEEAVQRIGAGDTVHLLGSVSQTVLPSLYKGADLFLFPSVSENAGSFALIDAFKFGVPVLSSTLSSMPEACQDGARYFDPRDPDSLASELLRVTRTPGLLDRLASQSRARGAEYHGWNSIAAALVEFAVRTVPCTSPGTRP